MTQYATESNIPLTDEVVRALRADFPILSTAYSLFSLK